MVELKQNSGLTRSRIIDTTTYTLTPGETEEETYRLTLSNKNNIILGYRWKCSLTGGAVTDAGNYPRVWLRTKQTDSDTSTTSINIDSMKVKRGTPGTENSEWGNVIFGTDYFSQKVSSQLLLPPYLMGRTSYDFFLMSEIIGGVIAGTSVTDIELEIFYLENGIIKNEALVKV